MSRRPWMPLYIGDYLADTGHLSTLQHGIYFLLMLQYWTKGSLPDDDFFLAKIAGLDMRTWRKHRPTVEKFFQPGWKHKRIEAELRRQADIAHKRSIAGQKGALKNIVRFPPKPRR